MSPVAIGLLIGTAAICYMRNDQFKPSWGSSSSILPSSLFDHGWDDQSRNECSDGGVILAGATTILGNAAGAVSAAYFSSQGLDKKRFMGTNAVFFFLVNVSKIPLMLAATQIKLRMGFEEDAAQVMNGSTFLLTAIFLAPVILGSYCGRRIYKAIPAKVFVPFILSLNFITAVYIVVTSLV